MANETANSTIVELPKRKGRRAIPKGIEPNNMLGQLWLRHAETTSLLSDIDLDDVLVCRPDGDAPEYEAPVVFEGEVELKMRKLISHFGFSRLPFTCLELVGLHYYCQFVLSTAAAVRNMPESEAPIYAESACQVAAQVFPGYAAGLRAYLSGSPSVLRGYHGTPTIYEELGREYLRQAQIPVDDSGQRESAEDRPSQPPVGLHVVR